MNTEKETTNGANTEQGKDPAPAAKKHFKPVSADWTYNPKTPLNYRPKGAQQDFVVALIKELGTQQLAIEKCVQLAMENKKPAPMPAADQSKEIKRLQDLSKGLERNLSIAQKQYNDLKAATPSGYVASPEAQAILKKIQANRKLESIEQAIAYCIGYVNKNDWL